MLNITSFYSNIEGTISVNENVIANISANMSTDGNVSFSKTVVDPTTYAANLETCIADTKEFEEKVIKDFNK